MKVFCFSLLADGFSRFRAAYPEWCDSCQELSSATTAASGPDPLPLMGLRSLRISAAPLHRPPPHRSCDSLSSAANSSTDSSDTDDRCDSSLGKQTKHKSFYCFFLFCFVCGDSHCTGRLNLFLWSFRE